MYFEENSKAHLGEAAREFDMAIGKILKILRKDLKCKAYQPHTSQVLTQNFKERRIAACDWFLPHDEDFFEIKVIWSDVKYFVLK